MGLWASLHMCGYFFLFWNHVCSYHTPAFLRSLPRTCLASSLQALSVCAVPQKWIQAQYFPGASLSLHANRFPRNCSTWPNICILASNWSYIQWEWQYTAKMKFSRLGLFSFVTSANCYLTHSVWGKRFTYKCFLSGFPYPPLATGFVKLSLK